MSLAIKKYFESREDDNLTGLAELTTETILEAVKNRYLCERIYTYIGEILISVNPFKDLPIYSPEIGLLCDRIVQNPGNGGEMVPHIYNVACKLYHTMYHTKKQQVCVISGESGAGKTESAKLVIQEIVNISVSSGTKGFSLSNKILMVNPILEAFGNAQTLFNDNSSRFGKYIDLTFDNHGAVTGVIMAQYLLEKSRVTFQSLGERNFHVFYYLLAGIAKSSRKELFLNVAKPSNFLYLSNYRFCDSDCATSESLNNFHTLCNCLDAVGFTKVETIDIFRVLELVLHIGNVAFMGEDQAVVQNTAQIHVLSELLGIDSTLITQALTVSVNTARNETITIPYNSRKACDVRDATAKALYERVFSWIVHKINDALSPPPDENCTQIGILDIFGFESFKRNGFEQFCINLANEQLQHYFNQYIFSMELEEYQKEGLEGLKVSFKDNTNVINLFLNRPFGLISLLDEQTRFPKGDDRGLLQKTKENITRNKAFVPDFGDELFFTIKHYAGNVRYSVQGFIEINRDTLPNNIVTLLQQSQSFLISLIFTTNPTEVDPNTLLAPSRRGSRLSTRRGLSGIRGGGSVRKKWGVNDSNKSITATKNKGNSKTSVAGQFRKSLEWLMAKLCSANPHFIRCIKPNPNKLPNTFQCDFVSAQLGYTGTLETVRVRREGYSYRPLFSEFVEVYSPIAYNYLDRVKPNANVCLNILAKSNLTEFKIGKSKIFLKYFHQDHLNRRLMGMHKHATLLQKNVRGYLTRKCLKGLYTLRSKQEAQLTIFLNSINTTSPFILQRQNTMIQEDDARQMARLFALEPALEPEVTREDIEIANELKYTVIPIIHNKKELKKLAKKQKKNYKAAKKTSSVPPKTEIVPIKSKVSLSTLQPAIKAVPHGEIPREQVFIAVDPDYSDIFDKTGISADELSGSASDSEPDISLVKDDENPLKSPRIVKIGQVTTFSDDSDINIRSPMRSSMISDLTPNLSADLYSNESALSNPQEFALNSTTDLDRSQNYLDMMGVEPIYSNIIPKNKVSNLINKYEIDTPMFPPVPPKSPFVRAMAINTSPEQKEAIDQQVITALARDQSLRRWRATEIQKYNENQTKWFHGMITREEAESILISRENGTFLVRQSEHRLGYALSVVADKEVHHYMVETLPGGRYRLKGSRIEHMTLQELILYYTNNIISERFREKLGKPADRVDLAVDYSNKKSPVFVKIKDLFKRKKK